jgi:hypothetical protein
MLQITNYLARGFQIPDHEEMAFQPIFAGELKQQPCNAAILSNYCDVCADMFTPAGMLSLWGNGYVHRGAAACIASAKNGCSLCQLIVDNATSSYHRDDLAPLVFKGSCERAIPILGEMHICGVGGASLPLSLDTLMADIWSDKLQRRFLRVSELAVFSERGELL